MFVITCSNVFITDQSYAKGLDEGSKGNRLTWPSYGEAMIAARNINAHYGMNTYVHPADRTDLTKGAVTTHNFGYSQV